MIRKKLGKSGWIYEENAKKAEKMQVVVLEGLTLPANQEKLVTDHLKKLGAEKAITVGVIVTKPGQGGTGGRHDGIFAVDAKDIGKFSVQRLQFRIRWWEDYVAGSRSIIPSVWLKRLKKKW